MANGIVEKLKRRIGETGEVLDAGIAWVERQAKQTADMNIPVLSKVTDAVVQPALVGTRAAIANATSGGGKYYQPEVRDERYFSKNALRELGASVRGMKGRPAGRADGMDNAAQFNLTQTLGGFSVQNGAVTDKFDINKSYYAVPDAATKVARFVLGAEEDPDAGKIKTRIPLDKLGVQQASKAGDAPRRSDLSNFLATDEVPESLFGIPVVASPERYTQSDVEFFESHPRAGGFYELGDEDTEDRAAEAAEGAGVPKEPPRYYKVRPGDNLTKISKATGVSVDDIKRYSKLDNPNEIAVDQRLSLTAPYPGAWNNPGNVRWNSKVVREGETGKVKSKVSDGYFLTFDTPQNGLNAQAQVIGVIARSTIPERYQKGELPNAKFTVSNLINVYAPPEDKNDTSGYVRFVADKLGVDKDEELIIDDARQMSSLLQAIVARDSKPEYAKWFRESEYADAVKMMKTPVKLRKKSGEKGK